METIDKHRIISIVVFIAVVMGCNALFWKLIALRIVDRKDVKTVKVSKDYTDSTAIKSFNLINNKLDTLIDGKDGK